MTVRDEVVADRLSQFRCKGSYFIYFRQISRSIFCDERVMRFIFKFF